MRARQTKNGIKFYNGRRLATEQESKDYIKTLLKANAGTITPENLADEKLKKYAQRAKGGIIRSQNALTDSGGKFLTGDLQNKALKKLGVNIEALKKAKKVDTIRQLFADENLKKRFDTLIASGVVSWYSLANLHKRIDIRDVKEIEINNEIVTDIKATAWTEDIFIEGRRNLKAVDIAFKVVTIGLDKMIMTLPQPSDIQDYEDAMQFNEAWGEWVIMYASEVSERKGKSKAGRATKIVTNGKNKIRKK